jgi:hypothetical protein
VDEMASHSDDQGEARGRPDRPANFVAAVIHNKNEFDLALEELRALGIDESSFGVLHGERGAAAIASRGRHWLDFLSDESRYVERYEEEIRAGGLVVGVALDRNHEKDRDRVRQILRDHGAHFIVSRTPWTHEVDDYRSETAAGTRTSSPVAGEGSGS